MTHPTSTVHPTPHLAAVPVNMARRYVTTRFAWVDATRTWIFGKVHIAQTICPPRPDKHQWMFRVQIDKNFETHVNVLKPALKGRKEVDILIEIPYDPVHLQLLAVSIPESHDIPAFATCSMPGWTGAVLSMVAWMPPAGVFGTPEIAVDFRGRHIDIPRRSLAAGGGAGGAGAAGGAGGAAGGAADGGAGGAGAAGGAGGGARGAAPAAVRAAGGVAGGILGFLKPAGGAGTK
jgi:hypothetical protein